VAQQARGGGPQLSQELARQLSDITKMQFFPETFWYRSHSSGSADPNLRKDFLDLVLF